MKMSADVEGPVRAIKVPTLIRKFNIGVEAEFSFPSWSWGGPFRRTVLFVVADIECSKWQYIMLPNLK